MFRGRGFAAEGALEDVFEIVPSPKIVLAVLLRLGEETGVHHAEDDFSEILAGADPPVGENVAGEGAVFLQSELPDPLQEFPAADVTALAEIVQEIAERALDENVGLQIVPFIPDREFLERAEVFLVVLHGFSSIAR